MDYYKFLLYSCLVELQKIVLVALCEKANNPSPQHYITFTTIGRFKHET